MKTLARISALAACAALLVGAGPACATTGATPATAKINAEAAARLPLQNRQDFDDARRGFIATIPDGIIRDLQGKALYDLKAYDFLLQSDQAPDTVSPGLWRIGQLNTANGLFKVSERIYQIRGFDIANMSIIEGEHGLIVIDPLTTQQGAAAGLALYYQHRPHKPVTAVIYTHSHADHFGGIHGVLSDAELSSGKVRIIGPEGFLDEAVSENLLAGNAMLRRASFQFGQHLPKSSTGQVDAGLGKSVFSGSIGLIAPTETITRQLETLRVDDIEIVFQLTPGTEAPAEMNLYFPQFKALNLAENATHTLHNLLPLRGAQVRDAKGWARYINQTLDLFGARSDVLFAQHHWPTWGQPRIAHLLAVQRDLYGYLHNQTLYLLNQGYTAAEIAERIRLPESLEQEWSAHGLYGNVKHNVKAIYQRYLGWYDANPAHLDPLPGAAGARKTLAYMGGAEAVLKRAAEDFERGEYRWVAQVLDVVVQAEPDNSAARELAARAFEQLAYVAEASTWRNAYLQGASELRQGPPTASKIALSPDFLRALSIDNVFDYLAVRIDGLKAAQHQARINWHFTDSGRQFVLKLEHGVLSHLADRNDASAEVTVTLDRATFKRVIGRQQSWRDALREGQVKLEGKPAKLAEVFGLIEDFPTSFPIVTPRN